MLPGFNGVCRLLGSRGRALRPAHRAPGDSHEGGSLTGWFLRADNSRVQDHWSSSTTARRPGGEQLCFRRRWRLARGYNCLIFNGPGQGDSLWLRKLYFRPDWREGDKLQWSMRLLRRPEVDAKRIASSRHQPGRLLGAASAGVRAPHRSRSRRSGRVGCVRALADSLAWIRS